MPAGQLALSEDLSAADLDRLLAQPEVAMDTETLGLDVRRDPLCLVQVADGQGIVNLVRARDWKQAANLRALLLSPVTKVFHNAVFDCSVLLVNAGVEVANPYCTRIASKLARTYGTSHSLATLVPELLGIELSKQMQVSDWSGELAEAQLQYAARDVLHLLEVKRQLEAKMKRRPLLATGISLTELNQRCQKLIPALAQLKANGWMIEGESSTFFGH